MTEFVNDLMTALKSDAASQFLTYLGPLLAIVVASFIAKQREVLKVVKALANLFFYNEPDAKQEKEASLKIIDLEIQLANIHKMLSSKNIEGRRQAIEAELEEQISRNLPDVVTRKLEETRGLDESVDSLIRKAVEDSVSAYLSNHTPDKMIKDQREYRRMAEREMRGKVLESTIQEQMTSAGRLKTVMINLFVVFNLGVLSIYIFGSSTLTDRAVTAIIGLYVSLAAFIVYIYRTSNFRSSVLLALREDAKKYYDADDYIRRLKPGASPTERDVEVLKLLLLNRAEREKMADHPYELILKGVSNSNIQLKGGKMISTSKSEK